VWLHHSFSLLVQESCRQGDGIASYIFFIINLQARSGCAHDPGESGDGLHATFDVSRAQMLKSTVWVGHRRGARLFSPIGGDMQLQANCAARQHRAAVRETSIAGLSMVSPSLKAMVYVWR